MAFDPPFVLLPFLQCLHALSFCATHIGAMQFLARVAAPGQMATAQGDLAAAQAKHALEAEQNHHEGKPLRRKIATDENHRSILRLRDEFPSLKSNRSVSPLRPTSTL
jgi:hypothetical protein